MWGREPTNTGLAKKQSSTNCQIGYNLYPSLVQTGSLYPSLIYSSGPQIWVTQVCLDYSSQTPSPPDVLARVSGSCSPRTPGLPKVGNPFSTDKVTTDHYSTWATWGFSQLIHTHLWWSTEPLITGILPNNVHLHLLLLSSLTW